MAKVIWKRMVVRGFGPYAEHVEIELWPAANVLVAPNETGKSTLVAAFAAILYGLPATVDPERFGQGRYRHWGQASRFEGELLLSVDGVDYHLTRQFATHKVSLRRCDNDRWRLLIDEVTDNPESRRPNPQYRRFLQETIGLGNRELFAATFCLAQPLPSEVELDSAVQQLLSGTGSRYDQVSKALETKIKDLTRYYGAALGDKSKGNKDRRLEQIERQIADLEQQIASGRSSADGLQAVQRQLQATREQLAATQERLLRREALEKAWLQWRSEQERHDAALRSTVELEQAAAAAQTLAKYLSGIDDQIRRQYDELATYGDELEPRLEAMQRLQQQITGVDEEQVTLQTELQATTKRLAQLEREQQALPAILRSPSVVADHARLLELTAAHRRRLDDRAAWQAALAQVENDLAQLPDFTLLVDHPATVLADLAGWLEQCAQVHDRWQACRQELERVEGVMRRDYATLTTADPPLLSQAANYSLRRMELSRDEQTARHAYEQMAAAEAAYQEVALAFARRCGEPTVSAPEMLSAVTEKIQQLQVLSQIKAEHGGGRASTGSIALLWLVGVVSGGLAAWRLGGPVGWGLAVLITLLVGGGGRWLLSHSAMGRSTPTDTMRQKIVQLDQSLGPLADSDLQQLMMARSMLEQLVLLASKRPDPDRLSALYRAWERSQEAFCSWQSMVRPLSDAFVDPQAAYGEWQALEQQRKMLRQEMRLLAQQLGCDVLIGAEGLASLVARPHLSTALQLLAVSVATVEELLAAVRGPSKRWQQLAAQALCWEELSLKRQRLLDDLTKADLRGADGLTVDERLVQDATALRQRLAPFSESSSSEELHSEIERYRALTQEIERCRALVEEQKRRLKLKQSRMCELTAQWHESLQPIASLWERYGADLAALRAHQRGYGALMQEREQLTKALQAALQSRQVSDLAELERIKTDQVMSLLATKNRWQLLIDQHPGLPAAEEAKHSQTVADRYQSLQDELSSLREQIAELRRSEDELRERQAALQGQSPINIAAAGDELIGLKTEREQLKRELAALGLAYGELRAAISEYEGSYRERLAQQATAYFCRITGDASRTVELGTDFSVTLVLAGGRTIVPRQLSQGARDQLYISLRLAIADLMAADLTLPIILDDPFVNCDQERLARCREALEAMGSGRQILLLTHQAQMSAWGHEVTMKPGVAAQQHAHADHSHS